MATLNNSLSNYLFEGTNDADSLVNSATSVTIYGYMGNDTIDNSGDKVLIYGADGNDSVNNAGSVDDTANYVTINTGVGDDQIFNSDSNVTINAGADNDYVMSYSAAYNVVVNGEEGDDTIESYSPDTTISSGIGNDSIYFSNGTNATVNSGEGNDTIETYVGNVIIDSDSGDDYIVDSSRNSTIISGTGNDYISLLYKEELMDSVYFGTHEILYTEGDGNDTITGYNSTDTINITSSSGYSTQTSGNDLIINVGEGSMRLVDAASIAPVIVVADLVDTGSGETDTTPSGEDTTPAVDTTTGGEDTITSVTTPADVSTVYVDLSTIDSDSGAFVIDGTSSNATFKSAAAENETVVGNVAGQIYTAENILPQSINNNNANWTINATAQNDSITNYASNVSINAGEGDNYIRNNDNCTYVTVTAGSGNDKIQNYGRFAVINAGDGNDSILTDINANVSSNDSEYRNVTVYGGAGNDTLDVNDHESLLDGGAGNDVIRVKDSNRWKTNTLQGGTGNDTLYGGGSNVFVYNEGDGDDLVKNYRTGDAIKISTTYDSIVSGNDIILNIAGDGHITLESAYSQAVIINDETIHGGVSTSTMHMSRWSYSFGTSTVSGSSNLASSEDLINGGEVSYYYGRGSQITYNADKNDTVNLYGVSLEQITSAEISAGAVKIGFNDGGNLTMLGQSNSQFVLNGSTWTADQSTQTWIKTS